MSSHIMEIQGCSSKEDTEQLKKEINLCGATVDSERTSFNHKPTRLFITLRFGDQVTEASFLKNLSFSSAWVKCNRLIKIQRGNILGLEKNLLVEK